MGWKLETNLLQVFFIKIKKKRFSVESCLFGKERRSRSALELGWKWHMDGVD